MKKILTLFLSTLMVLTSIVLPVYAEGNEEETTKDTQDVNLSYTVEESYSWSVPSKIEFSADSYTDVSATDNDSQVKISEFTLSSKKSLIISVDKDNDFKLTDSNDENHTLDYSVKAGESVVSAGETIIQVKSGDDVNNAYKTISASLTRDTVETAGTYTGRLVFKAEIVLNPDVEVEEGTTATNVKINPISSSLEADLKAELKAKGDTGLTNSQIDNAVVFEITADDPQGTPVTVKLDASKLVQEGHSVIVYHKGENGWEVVGTGVVGNDGIITCQFDNFSPIVIIDEGSQEYTITVKTNNSNYGKVRLTGNGKDEISSSISKSFAKYSQVTLGVMPKDGYMFIKWDDGDTNEQRIITVDSDKTYTATFGVKPEKGDLITIENKQYRVLKNVKNSEFKVFGMDKASTSTNTDAKFGYLESDPEETIDNKKYPKYAGSSIDTYLNETWYGAQSETLKAAIVDQNITQGVYKIYDAKNNPDFVKSDNYTSWGKNNFVENTTLDTSDTTNYKMYIPVKTNEIAVGSRHVYAIDYSDINAYLGSNWTPQAFNELFFNSKSSINIDLFTRTAADPTTNYSRCIGITGIRGCLDAVYSGNTNVVHPVFVVDLSKIDYSIVK